MSIDTEITGSPASIRAAAGWLGGNLRPAVAAGAQSMVAARREAVSDWRGATGEAFSGAMARGVTACDTTERAVTRVHRAFDDYADTLQRCQDRMAAIRDRARAEGLTVTGFVIAEPGAGPARPGDPPLEGPPRQVDAYDAAVTAWHRHQELIRAYNFLAERAQEVWNDLERAWQEVAATDRALDGVGWSFQAADLAGGLGGAMLTRHGSILRDTAHTFGNQARTSLQRLRTTSRVFDVARFYDDVDHYTRMGAGAADDLARANRVLTAGKAVPLAAGGLLTGVGVWYDMEHGGESAAQAVTSNVGGFAASVVAGAAIGSFGGPVGTVAGIVVGAGVGVFTSGMLDGLWEHDGDVSDAFLAGIDSLSDTTGAVVDGAVDVGGAIVDGIGGLFD